MHKMFYIVGVPLSLYTFILLEIVTRPPNFRVFTQVFIIHPHKGILPYHINYSDR